MHARLPPQGNFFRFGTIRFQERLELLLILLLSFFIYMQNFEPVESWLVSHWLFDYEHGFTKRGLIGEIYRLVQHDISYRQIELIGFVLGLILTLQVAYLTFVAYRRAGNPLLPLLILLAPFTIPAIALENARFDTINYIIALTFLLLPRSLRTVPLAAAISILMLLIHEASFFIHLPLVLLATAFDGKELNLRRLFICLGIAGVALGAIVLFSHMDIGRTEFVAYLRSKLPPTGTALTDKHFAGYYVLFVTFFENIEQTLKLLFSVRGIIGAFTVAVFLVCWFKLARYIPDYLRLNTPNAWLLLFLTGSSPLVLVCLGVDWYRWCTLMSINALAATSFLVLQENATEREPEATAGPASALKRSSLYLFLFFAVVYPQFPPWHPVSGTLKDGIQCLAADYGFFSRPEKRTCPSADFLPKS